MTEEELLARANVVKHKMLTMMDIISDLTWEEQISTAQSLITNLILEKPKYFGCVISGLISVISLAIKELYDDK